MSNSLSPEMIDAWADGAQGPVALHLKQTLLPVEGKGGVIFPPTYAGIGYNIDTLADGTKIAQIDSVGSQANRMEPIFKRESYSHLVPQIEIELHSKEHNGEKHVEKISLLDLAHRSADAGVRCCPELAPQIEEAFRMLKQKNDAAPLCRLAPTSLVFGFWDSRGESGEKHPRLVRSIIRAWNVQPLRTSAQFNSIWKAFDKEQKSQLEKKAKDKKLALEGLADVPSVSVPGGVLAEGEIVRDVTVNLVALRAIGGTDARRYLLALTLIAATAEIELFLREGCHLRYTDDDQWNAIPRRGDDKQPVDLSSKPAQETLLKYAEDAARPFREKWPRQLHYKFDIKKAQESLKKKKNKEDED